MKEHDVPVGNCLACHHLLEAATNAFTAQRPEPGDFSVCLHCGHVMVFTRTLRLRNPNSAEMHTIAGDERLLKLQRARKLVLDKK